MSIPIPYGHITSQHPISHSARSRRPSPLLHEIQSPSRRLSSHQVLLLTPFGGAIPAGALSAPAEGMTRGSSRMGSTTPSYPRTGPYRPSHSGNIGISASSLGPPRVRHHSLMNTTAPSPLSSAPMTTIQSASDLSSSEGASASGHEGHVDTVRTPARMLLETIAMTRSNSLPVSTLRELEALKLKDGELGIARGGEWAWVSREGPEDESADESLVQLRTSLQLS